MTGSLNLIFFAQLNGRSHISPKNIEEIQLLSFLKRQNVAELENHINQMNLSTFLLKKSSGSVSLKLLMHTLFSTRLFSSTPRKLLEEELEHTGLAKFFSISVAGDEIIKHKPDPEGFNKILEIGKFNPENVLVLGDAQNDILGAKASGISSCLFLPIENKIFYDFNKLKETNPIYCVETLNDFADTVINAI